MINKKETLVSKRSFPDQLAPDYEKESFEYGLKVGQAIQYEWFRKKGNSCKFYDQWIDFHRMRLYARGEQSVESYKKQLEIDGDKSYLNLDWSIVPIIPKFRDIVVNGMMDRVATVKAYAQDGMAAEQRSSYQEMLEADMIARDVLMMTKEQFGVDAFNVDPETLPKNDQELSLHMQLNYKPAIEIAEEEAIDTVFDMNKFPQLKRRLAGDQVDLGLCVAKHRFSHGEGIKLEYVDPSEWVHSYTEDPNYEDCYYFGEVKQIHITELKKINPNLTDEELNHIKKTTSMWSTEYSVMRSYNDSFADSEVVNVLFFNYKTDKNFVWKEKILDNGGKRVISRDDSFNPPADGEAMFRRVEKKIDVWYDGVLVLGTDQLIKWEMCTNMVRPESAFQKAYPGYIAAAPKMYKGSIESLVRRMRKYADQIQIIHLKLQQVVSKVVPDGIYIDADGLTEIDLGDGGSYSPQKALQMYFQTGSVIGRSYTQDGEYNHAKIPIQEINHNSGHNKIQSLINYYNYNMQMIRDVTGINEARDGSTPDPDALVGVQKLAAANSNTATRHVLDAILDVTQKLAECTSLRIADVLEYSDMSEEFAMQIGKYKVSLLDEIKNLYLHSFGVFLEVAPDEEERQRLENDISIALQRDQISIDDKIDIMNMRNLKLASEMLKLRKQEKAEKDQQYEQQKMQMQAQINAQSAQQAAEARMQAAQAEAQAKIQIETAKSQLDLQKMNEEAKLKLMLMEREFQYQMGIKGEESKNLKDRETYKEDRKDERTKLQASQQSKMVQQRQSGTPPVDFESNEDSLDGFDFGEFMPR
jgi:hypothetical protein